MRPFIARLLHALGREVIWLEDSWGELYLTIAHDDKAFIYPFTRVGRLTLNSDHTTGGAGVSYIRYWKRYKPGVRYRRPPAPRSIDLDTSISAYGSITTNGTYASSYSNIQKLFEDAVNQASPSQAPILSTPVKKPETEEERVARLNKEGMAKAHPSATPNTASFSSFFQRPP